MTVIQVVTRALVCAVLSGALFLTTGAQGTASAAQGSDSDTRAEVQTSAGATEPLGKWKCGKWKKAFGTEDLYFRKCANFQRFNRVFDVDHRSDAFNKFRDRSIDWTCKHQETTTWKFSVSATVKAEAGVIFAKAEVSATAGVERSVTSMDEASASVEIKPREWAKCKRGAFKYNFKGTKIAQMKQGGKFRGEVRGSRKTFFGSAPSFSRYIYAPGHW